MEQKTRSGTKKKAQFASTIKSDLFFQSLLGYFAEAGPHVTGYIDRIIRENLPPNQPPPPDLWALCQRRPTTTTTTTTHCDPVALSSEAMADDGESTDVMGSDNLTSLANFVPSKRDIEKFNQRHVIDDYVLNPNSLCYYIVVPEKDDLKESNRHTATPTSNEFPHSVYRNDFRVLPIYLTAQQSRMVTSDQKACYDVFGRRERKDGFALCQLNFLRSSHRFKSLHRIRDFKRMIQVIPRIETDSLPAHSSAILPTASSFIMDGDSTTQTQEDDQDGQEVQHDKEQAENDDEESSETNETCETDEPDEHNEVDETDGPALKRARMSEQVLPQFTKSRQPKELRHATAKAVEMLPVVFDYPVWLRRPCIHTVDHPNLPQLKAMTTPAASATASSAAPTSLSRASTTSTSTTSPTHTQFLSQCTNLIRPVSLDVVSLKSQRQ